ncbi:MAG: hydrogenase iron-sulfur subunit [Dehalococcoidales bacterium]|nr:hydrogenase iron-sulfur subunit [Dehalococcoidales bacterium]
MVVKNMVEAPSVKLAVADTAKHRLKITVFHCFNALSAAVNHDDDYDIRGIKMPCSSMTREVFLLRAFEAGADAVVVLVCPEGSCRYLEGNIRAGKRVARMKKLLDEIGIDGRRLNIFHIPQGDESAIEDILNHTVNDLIELGPNPAS